jgi:lysophospholipid acyltransferase (LPLAT)-like uncharacterized protein
VKDGILFLASVSGRGIVPVTFAARKCWRPKGKWTDLVIPYPFTTVWLESSEPLYIPPGLTRDQLVPYRAQLQQILDDLSAHTEALAKGDLPDSPEPLIVASKPAASAPAA